jgi:2-phospho-L-lactate transferase CofD
MSTNRGIVIFSGGSAANSLVDVFSSVRESKNCPLSYIIPISDNGGSSSELIRVFGGPGIGDVRSMTGLPCLYWYVLLTYNRSSCPPHTYLARLNRKNSNRQSLQPPSLLHLLSISFSRMAGSNLRHLPPLVLHSLLQETTDPFFLQSPQPRNLEAIPPTNLNF